MSNGNIFLLAFIPMIVLIGWIIWDVSKGKAPSIVYSRATPYPNKQNKNQAIVLGIIAVIAGVFLYWLVQAYFDYSIQLKITAVGIILLGILSIVKGRK